MTNLINKNAGNHPLANFHTSGHWSDDWTGNGHTTDTDPTRKGWKVKKVKNHPELVVLGLVVEGRQQVGCASIRQLGDKMDVVVYVFETPAEVVEAFDNDGIEGMYHMIPSVSGWGLAVIRLIEAEVEMMARL